MDLFVVPTIGFRLLYAFAVIRLDRRYLVWVNLTTNPTAEWIARQITEAFPWNEAPRYLIRDRDSIYGDVFIRRLRAMNGQPRRNYHGRMAIVRGSSVRSDGTALTTLLYLASATFAKFFNLTRTATIKLGRIYR